MPISIAEWFDNIPFDSRCPMVRSRCVQVSSLLPLGCIGVVSQHIRQVAIRLPAAPHSTWMWQHFPIFFWKNPIIHLCLLCSPVTRNCPPMVTPRRPYLREGSSAARVHAEEPRVQVSVEERRSEPSDPPLTINTCTQNFIILCFDIWRIQCISVCVA